MVVKSKWRKLMAVFLIISMICSLSVTSLAVSGETVGDGNSTTVTIKMKERFSIMHTTDGVKLNGYSWEYTTNNGITGPAYCIDWGLKNPASAKSLTIAGKYTANPKTTGAFANGYPQRSLEDFIRLNKSEYPNIADLTREEYISATQIAIWATLGQVAIAGTGFESGRAWLEEPGTDMQKIRVYDAIRIILNNARYWDRLLVTGLSFRLGKTEGGSILNIEHEDGIKGAEAEGGYGIKKETINGVEYYTRSFVVSSATSTFKHDYCIDVYAENAPDGSIITDLNNKALNNFVYEGRIFWRVPTPSVSNTNMNENGQEYAGEFKLCIPVRNTPESGNILLHGATTVTQYDIYLANNTTNTEQSYIIADPMYAMMYCDGAMKWEKVTSPYGRIVLNKTDGMGNPLPGAIFSLNGTDGKVYEGTSNSNGQVIWEYLNPDIQYTLTEVQAPEGYLKAEPMTVSVPAGQTQTLTIKNVSKRTVRIRKIDEQNGSPILGATFRIEQTDGSYKTDVTTSHSGVIELKGSDLPYGSYKVYEIKAPDGYEKDTEPQAFDWNGTQDVTLTFKNVREPSLVVVKKDKHTDEPLEDVVFNVYKDGKFITSVITDNAGYARISGLQEGYYEIEEAEAPAGYVKDTKRHGVHIDPYNPATDKDPVIVITNERKPSLIIEKLDNKTGEPVEGTTFAVYKDTTLIGEYTTDRHGLVELEDLEPGTYTVKEIHTDNEHVLQGCPQSIEVMAGKEARLIFFNKSKPGIGITKIDKETKKPLEGAVFRIEKIDGSITKAFTTDKNGEIELEDLEPGAYTVAEITPPEGYVLNTESRSFVASPDESVQLVFTNTRKPDIKITKIDSENGMHLKGAVIRIMNSRGEVLDKTTDDNGEIVVTGVEEGLYTIQEIHAPEGYLYNSKIYYLTAEAGKSNELVIRNTLKPSLVINKIDAVTKDVLKNAVFEIVYASNKTDTGEINNLGTFRTDDKGQIKLSNLKDGWYKISEKEAPDGYVLSDEVQEIYVKAGEEKEVTFENTPLSAMVIKKVDAATGKVLQGAKFKISYLSGESGTGGTVIGEYTTSVNGTIVINRLKPGTYVVEETKAPDGYIINDAPETVYITGKEQDVISVEFENYADGGLIIRKLDSITKEPLSGAEFKVTTSDGKFVPNQGGAVSSNGIYTTDRTGQIHITGIEAGTTLVVTETKAPDGYVLETVSQTVKIDKSDTQTLTFYNEPIGGLRITKIDEETRQPIKNVKFSIEKMDGERIGTYSTDSNGVITVDGLEEGWYVVTETKAAKGYQLDTEPHEAEVKNGKVTRLTITNRKESSFLIHKVDSVTGKGIYGVTFLVSDRHGNPVAQYTSDHNGYVYMDDRDFEDGKYYIREISVPKGYILDTEVKTFYVEYGETSSITWYNTPTQAQIQIIKKSADDNPINGLPAGSLLEGAVFEIYDRGGNTVDTIKTDKNGRAASKTLPLGLYTVREIKAPANYIANEIIMNANLEFSGQIVTFEVLNRSVVTGVSIIKRGYTEVMPDNPLSYSFSNIKNASTVPLSSFYFRDTLPSAIRGEMLVTGTFNQPLSYKIVYLTNLSNGEYRTLNDNLSTKRNYALDITNAALGLASNEYITEIMFVFGTVKAGFSQVETPYLYARSIKGLTNGMAFVNQADVGGVYNGQWITSVSRWTTKVYSFTHIEMPRTGY